jgi:hypothetical protein
MTRPASSAVAIALVTLAAGCGGGDDTPDSEQVTKAVADYAHAFGNGDGDKACALLTPGARDAFTSRVSSLVGTRDCAEAMDKLQAVAGPNVTGPFQDATASEPKVEGDTATVTLKAGGASEQVKLEKRDGEWLLTRAPGT